LTPSCDQVDPELEEENAAIAEIWEVMPFVGGVSMCVPEALGEMRVGGWSRCDRPRLLHSSTHTCPCIQATAMLAPGRVLNFSSLLPLNRSYVTYTGSLTTPPCSEGVMWHVMTQPQSISLRQARAVIMGN